MHDVPTPKQSANGTCVRWQTVRVHFLEEEAGRVICIRRRSWFQLLRRVGRKPRVIISIWQKHSLALGLVGFHLILSP